MLVEIVGTAARWLVQLVAAIVLGLLAAILIRAIAHSVAGPPFGMVAWIIALPTFPVLMFVGMESKWRQWRQSRAGTRTPAQADT